MVRYENWDIFSSKKMCRESKKKADREREGECLVRRLKAKFCAAQANELELVVFFRMSDELFSANKIDSDMVALFCFSMRNAIKKKG